MHNLLKIVPQVLINVVATKPELPYPPSPVKEDPEPIVPIKHDDLKWMTWAKYHLGKREGVNDAWIVNLHELSQATYKTKTSRTPWCAYFVGAALFANGLKGSKSAAAKSYDAFGLSCKLQYGAIVTLKHKDGSRHVGFCYDPKPNSKTFSMLGGNQSNRVRVTDYDKGDIMQTRWPI